MSMWGGSETRPERVDLMNIPLREVEHRTKNMEGKSRVPIALVIILKLCIHENLFIYLYIHIYIYIYIYIFLCIYIFAGK